MAKLLAVRYAIGEIVFFRCLFALAPATCLVLASGGWRTLRTDRFWSHATRAALGLLAMALMFWSFALLPLADAVAIGFSGPLFLTVLSIPFLGERVGSHLWGTVLVGFAGVLLMVKPDGNVLNAGALVALGSALAYALVVIAIRRLTKTERTSTIVFLFTMNATVLSAAILPAVWAPPTASDLALMALTGLCGGASQYLTTRAYALGPASVIGPFTYASILWAVLFGYLVWGDVPDPWVIVGAAIVISCGLFIAHRETRPEPKP